MNNLILVVMGVSGSGKTTVAKALAKRLDWPFQEGDSLHPAANVEKMSHRIPLTDADRWPWLAKVADWIDGQVDNGQPGVITCSMLKRSYRDKVIGTKPGVRLMFLDGDEDVLAERMAKRKNHYMPSSLLASQLATLERPTPDERPIVVDFEGSVDEVVEAALKLVEEARRSD